MYFPALERLPPFLVSSLVTLTFPLGSIIRLQGKAVTLEPAQKSCKKKGKGKRQWLCAFSIMLPSWRRFQSPLWLYLNSFFPLHVKPRLYFQKQVGWGTWLCKSPLFTWWICSIRREYSTDLVFWIGLPQCRSQGNSIPQGNPNPPSASFQNHMPIRSSYNISEESREIL